MLRPAAVSSSGLAAQRLRPPQLTARGEPDMFSDGDGEFGDSGSEPTPVLHGLYGRQGGAFK